MARFSIISKDGDKIRYEGKPRYIGTYLKPSYLEFSEIASPTPIDWQVGDYVDYPRTGMRYRLYSIPQASKNARKGSHGRAFTYSNVQLHAATKELEIALFKDLVSADNNIHFSTSPDVATFENVYGIARRIQACMDDLYPNRWVIKVADFNLEEDEEILENITTAKDFVLSGGTCLDALTKIYELWQEVGWIHTYDSASGKDVITIGYANKRIGANTTEPYIYGKGNGLTAIKKTQANKDEFATRLYVYGSDRNLPSRYYNNKNILNAESLDIRNLMLPIAEWGKTGNSPDARKAYLENAEAVAKYGVIPKTHYFDSDDAGADIYPTIEGITIGQVRRLQADYKPSTSIYPNDGERIDEVKSAVNPNDDGVIRPLGKAYKYYKIENVEAQKSEITLTDLTVVKVNKILLLTDLEGEGKVDMTVIPNIGFALDDAGFTEVNATFELTDSPTKTKRISQLAIVTAKKNEATGRWEFKAPRISVDYDYESTGSIPVSYVLTLEATLGEKQEGETITFDIEQGEIEIGANALLDKEFTITLKQIGFNIEERASIGSGKTISMKTGDNEGRNFVIKECRYEGSSDSWILTCRRQQDNNLGMLFPNKDYQIKQNDRFVLLDIAMLELYVAASMERLFAEGQKLLSKVSRIQNNYEPSIDAKVMAESGRTIREGMFMQIADEDIIDGATEYILIDTINIYEDEAAIPTYKVTLKEKKKVSYKGTPSATSTPNTSPVEGKTDVDLSNYVTKEQFKSVENLKDFFYKTEDGKSIGTRYNLFSEKEVSAKGLAVGEASGSGIIKNVLGLSSLGSVESNDNTTTFNAYAIDSIYKKVVELEQNGGGGGTDADLSNYYTRLQTDIAIATALEPYAKTDELDGKYAPLGEHNTIKTKVETLDGDVKAIEGNLSAIGEKVDTLDGSLSTLNGRVNALDEKVADYDTFKQSTSTSIKNLGKKDEAIASDIEGLGSQIGDIEKDINKVLGWFDVDENNNLFTTFNFYSTKEISSNGFNASSGEGGGGLITTVLGTSSFGSVSSNDNTTTFNAYAIDSLYKRIVELEGKDVDVDLSDYYTKGQTQSAINTALVPYLKSTDADGKYAPLTGFNTLKSDFDALNKALNDDVSGKVNTWNEIVDFLDEYSGSESLAVILERMNADIASKLLVSDFNSFKADDYNVFKSATNTAISALQKADESASSAIGSLQATVSGHTTQISGLTTRVSTAEGNISTNAKGIADNKAAIATNKGNISANATAITNLGKRVTANEDNITKILKWFAVDADNNLYTTYNFYSTKEISGKGLSQGTGGGSSYVRLDSWDKYDASAGAVLSATLGYGLKTSVDGHASRIGVLESQVGQLATQSTKVSVSNLLTTGTRIATITVDGVTKTVYAPTIPTKLSQFTDDVVSGKYLSLSGGTIKSTSFSPLAIDRNSDSGAAAVGFSRKNTILGFIGFNDTTGPKWFNANNVESSLIHSGNVGEYKAGDSAKLGGHAANFYPTFENQGTYIDFTLYADYRALGQGDGYIEFWDSGWYNSKWGKVTAANGFVGTLTGNASSATKLETARTIWGQSFDGTSNISGSMYIPNASAIYFKDTNAANRIAMTLNDGNGFSVGYGMAAAGYDTSVLGNNLYLKYGKSAATGLVINSSGNVTVGASDLALTTRKFFVGNSTENFSVATEGGAFVNTNNTAGWARGFYISHKGTKVLGIGAFGTSAMEYGYIGASYNTAIMYFRNKNVGIGTSNPAYKLDVNGTMGATGLITANSGVKVASGQAITFLDSSGKEHKLTYDSTAGAFKFDGHLIVLGDGQFNAING